MTVEVAWWKCRSDELNAMEDLAIQAVRQQLWKVPITTHGSLRPRSMLQTRLQLYAPTQQFELQL